MQFVDKAFARRLESCEEMPQVMYARLFQNTRPELGVFNPAMTLNNVLLPHPEGPMMLTNRPASMFRLTGASA